MPTPSSALPPRPHARRTRALGALAAALTLAACAAPAAEPASSRSPQAAEAVDTVERLVVADPAASAVHAFSVPGHDLLGTLENVAVVEHAGVVPLEDGRLLVASREPAELLALAITDEGPTVQARAPLPGPAIHVAVDPAAGVAAASSGVGEGRGALTVVDLATLEPRATVEVDTEEPGLALVDGVLLHRDGAEQGTVEAFDLDTVLAGDGTEAVASAATGAWGHGEAVVDGHLLQATDAGLERFRVDGAALEAEGTVPWAADGADWGRAYYLRVHGDDAPHAWSYVRDQTSPSWGEWRNDLWVLAPGAGTAQRRPLGPGLAFRFATGGDRALFARMHPDGYAAHVVDADPESPTFLETLHTVALPTPTKAPVREDDVETVWASPGRPIGALTHDGTTGYVSRGGDGVVDVLDTASGTLTGELAVPTPLDGGGYLAAVRAGVPLVDGLGR